MDTNTLIIIAAVVVGVVVLGLVGWMYSARRRRERLRTRYGPEYQRVVQDAGSESRAEAVLAEREKRVSSYDIRDLNAEERGRFSESWRRVQAMFVDDPGTAVTEADMLVTHVMTARGYPMAEFERRAEDLTVSHGNVVHHYHQAREIASRHARKEASTEDLRQALVHYRELFADLLDLRDKQMRRSA